MTYLAAAAANPLVPPVLHPNPNGEITVLSPQNFTTTLAHGPTFVSFYLQYCNDCPLAVWRELTMATQHSMTIAKVYCGGDDNLGFCGVHSIPVGAGHEPLLIYYLSKGAPVKYTGPRKLGQRRVSEKSHSACNSMVQHVTLRRLWSASKVWWRDLEPVSSCLKALCEFQAVPRYMYIFGGQKIL
jgi:hypothetical protein